MEHERRGPSLINSSGGLWWPFDPRPEDFEIEDIAHHLALTCRYNGSTRYHYSVAEHSVLVSRHVPPEYALHGLLHDAAEAVVGDVVWPLKILPGMADFRRVEDRNLDAICRRFGVGWTPEAQEAVDDVDRRLVIDECLTLIPRGGEYLASKGYDLSHAVGADVVGYSPERAEIMFLLEWELLRCR